MNNKDLHFSLRGLKGGSGGGGGGGYSGGGGGCYGCYNNGSGGGGGSAGVIVGVMMFLVLCVVFGCCCYAKTQAARRSSEFQKLAEEIKAKQEENNPKVMNKSGIQDEHKPSSGVYTTQYMDRGKSFIGEASLTFEDERNQGRYSISGKSKDADGETTIEEGYVSYDGSNAWWKETNISGDVGLSVINHGTFNFETNTFSGEWTSSTGYSGTFTSFSLMKSFESFQQNPVESTKPEQTPVIPIVPVPAEIVDDSKIQDVEAEIYVAPVASSSSSPPTSTNTGTAANSSLFDQMFSGIKK